MEPKHILKDKDFGEVIRAISNKDNVVTISKRYKMEEIDSIGKRLLCQYPEFFYLDSFRYVLGSSTTIEPIYSYSIEDINRIEGYCASLRSRLLQRVQHESIYERVLGVHDLLSRNVAYSMGIDRELHTIVGPLLYKRGVCEGFAKSFKYLLDGIDVPNMLISGEAYNSANDSTEKHMWNVVCINGVWRHIDVTFDTTIRYGSILRYDYFCLTDDQIRLDHFWEGSKYPPASGDSIDYYRKNNLLMKKQSDLKYYVNSILDNGISDVVVKLPEMNNNNLVDKVMHILDECCKLKHFRGEYEVHYNQIQNVYHIHFASEE